MSETQFRASYRFQLRKEFTLQDAATQIAYLEDLGISHAYLSPILESGEGSNHGYDGIDPTKISTERGGEAGFSKFIARIDRSKIINGVILDIVPNHLSSSWKNPAWWDMLKYGPESKHWKTFDIKPRSATDHRVVLPVLGKSRQAALVSRELFIAPYNDELALHYFDKRYPLDPKTLTPAVKSMKEAELKKLPLKTIEELLSRQHYILKDWRVGSLEVNYRRFFDINDLAGIRIEDPEVFAWAHSKIAELVQKHPRIHGLRVDHVDGLTFPDQYLNELAKISKNVWVEKILGEGEELPESWPVLGSTGYEFSNVSARLFVDLKGLSFLHAHYLMDIDDRWERFHDCVIESKREMLETHFISELKYLTTKLFAAATAKRGGVDFTSEDLQETLIELTSSLKVYRTYAERGRPMNSRWLEESLAETEGRGRIKNRKAFDWLRGILLSKGDWSEDLFLTLKRWEQLSGPVMAKGLEDTALYRYCPLLSLNGVGGEPDWRGDGSAEYHAYLREQARTHPHNMNTTSTHDTKRSEDVRSRIHLLSELSKEWTQIYDSYPWKSVKNAPSKRSVYLILETMIGAWPFDGKITADFIQRMQAYFVKAAREAKTETSWSEVNEAYEQTLKDFVVNALKPKDPRGKKFLARLRAFAEKCTYFGAINSLSLVTLKALAPGLPDFYQGSELWDLSLVDPDNRRPVDYKLRKNLLAGLRADVKAAKPLAALKKMNGAWQNGTVKLWLTWTLLQLRLKHAVLFNEGSYSAIDPEGPMKHHFVAFLRQHGDTAVFVVVPRFLAQKQKPAKSLVVSDPQILSTEFILPSTAGGEWTNALTQEIFSGASFVARDLLKNFPIAVLVRRA